MPQTLGEIDLISLSDVTSLAAVAAPCVSLFLPTHRHGPETLQGPVRLRNLADEAERELNAADITPSVTEQILRPVRELIEDPPFWQHQGDGLAIFTSPASFSRFRVPIPLREEATVASSFRIRPLLPLVSSDGVFFILALSQNAVRLFEATRFQIGELDAAPLPSSMEVALAHEDPERQLQLRSTVGGAAQFHGHGAGAEVEKAALERYFRVVDRALNERLGSSRRPLVLACVGYYLPIFASVSRYPNLLDRAVEGNPDHRSAQELHREAWPLLEDVFADRAGQRAERYRQAVGTGATTTVVDEIVTAAIEGRVDTLFVDEAGPSMWGSVDVEAGKVTTSETRAPLDDDLVDRAAIETLVRGGEVVIPASEAEPDAVVAALLRY